MSDIKNCTIYFDDINFLPVKVLKDSQLIDVLTPENSPVTFGCCSGICGSCLNEVDDLEQSLVKINYHELETLELFGQANGKARLICQLKIKGDLKIKELNLLEQKDN